MIIGNLALHEGGGGQACIRPDRQCLCRIILKSAGQGDEGAGTVPPGEGSAAPGRRQASLVGHDPDLEDAGRLVLQVVFTVEDAGPGAHHLYVPGQGVTVIAEAVLMGDGAAAHVGDDFHVLVRVRGKPDCGAMISSFHTRRRPQCMRVGSWYWAKEKWCR